MEDAYTKIVRCAKAGELGTGTTLEFKEPRVALKAAIAVPPLLDVVQANLKGLGIAASEFKDFEDLASSDLGMVAASYPTVNVWFKIAPEGTALHSEAFREAANSDEAWKGAVVTGKAMALSAYEMLTKPEKLKAVQESFKTAKAKEGK
jgi:metal-dependent amidase/aminoacylase/carboxypeptidase family protein